MKLYDAVVLFIGDGVMTITGLEIDPSARYATAQSWYVELVDVRKRTPAR